MGRSVLLGLCNFFNGGDYRYKVRTILFRIGTIGWQRYSGKLLYFRSLSS